MPAEVVSTMKPNRWDRSRLFYHFSRSHRCISNLGLITPHCPVFLEEMMLTAVGFPVAAIAQAVSNNSSFQVLFRLMMQIPPPFHL